MNKKIPFLFVAVLLAHIVFIPVADAKQYLAAKFYVKEGIKDFKAKKYDDAIENFRKALLAQPDNEEALMYLKKLGYHGKKSMNREQDQLAKDSNGKPSVEASKAKTTKKTKKTIKKANRVNQVAKTPKKISKTSQVAKASDNDIKPTATAVVAESQPQDALDNENDEDQVLDAIDQQVTQEEQAALKAIRDQAAKDQELVLKKSNKDQKKAKPATSAKTAKLAKSSKPAKSSAKSPVKTTKAKSAVEETPALEENDLPAEDVKSAETIQASKISESPSPSEEVVPEEDPVGHAEAEESHSDADVQKFVENMDETSSEPVAAPVVKTPAVAKKAVTPQDREAIVVANIKREAADQEAELKEKIATQTAKKIELVHQKFEAKPISQKEKTITRDINSDGIEETISVTENKAIAKIEAQAVKDEQSGLKKIRKEAAQDEKVALKELRAQIKKEEKLRAKGNGSVPEATSSHAKAGDILANDQDIVIPDVSPVEHGKDRSAVVEEDQDMSSEEAAALAEIKDDLSQKEKDLQLKYAKKKAMRMEQAEKKARPRVQEAKVSLNEEEDLPVATQDAEVVTAASADTRIPAANPKSVQAQNVVLKKKFAQVVEMSQKDQDLIKNLETNVAQKEEKVDALESDLRETKTNLDSKVELIKQKEEKLKVLSDKIAAMESDVNSKQYDFKDKQLEYEKKLQAIQEEFGNYKAERANTEDELKEQLKILKLALEKKVAELNAAQEKLIFTESKLKTSEEKYAQTVKQYDEVKKTLSDLEDRLGALSEPAPVSDQAPLVTIDPQNLPAPKNQNEVAYQQWIKRQDLLVNKLKDKLLWAREQMEFLGRYDIKLSDQKMAALKEQLVAVKKQLNAQVPTGRTEEDFALMEGRLKDSQERLDMVEKILHEKDDQVKELEKQLNQVLSGF